MSAKRKGSVRTSVVTSERPEITGEWIAGADLYRGEKLVRRGDAEKSLREQDWRAVRSTRDDWGVVQYRQSHVAAPRSTNVRTFADSRREDG